MLVTLARLHRVQYQIKGEFASVFHGTRKGKDRPKNVNMPLQGTGGFLKGEIANKRFTDFQWILLMCLILQSWTVLSGIPLTVIL